MGLTERLYILLTVFISTAYTQTVQSFGVCNVRWPFLAEDHTAPLKRFVLSGTHFTNMF